MIATLGWGALAGFLSTMVMDMTHGVARKTGITVGLEPQLMGRWFQGLARMRLMHDDIRETASAPGELPTAMGMHFLIGITFGMMWSLIAHQIAASDARFFGGILFGIATNAAPALLMWPAMGFGLFGSRGPADKKLRVTSAVNHLMFGVALGAFSVLLPF
jgi:hypothetical protein